MKLGDAIRRAALFATPLKGTRAGGITTNLRLLPRPTDQPGVAKVYGTDGVTGCVVELDPGIDVPNIVLSAKALVDGFNSIPNATITYRPHEPGWAYLHPDDKAPEVGYKIGCYAIEHFPSLPEEPPEYDRLPNIAQLAYVVHACSEDAQSPELRYVHFRTGMVEASDARRIARATIPNPRQRGLVYSGVFKEWPDQGDGLLAIGESMAHFKLDAEWRFTLVYRANDVRDYPDLQRAVAPYDDAGAPYQAIVPVKQLMETIRKAQKFSPQRIIRLNFQRGKVVVSAHVADEQGVDVVGHMFEVPALSDGEDLYLAAADAMLDVLKVAETPNVMVSTYLDRSTPLIIRFRNFVEYLWPVVTW